MVSGLLHGALVTLFLLGAGCGASIPKTEHEARLAEERRAYEDRLFRAEEARRRTEKTQAAELASAREAERLLGARVEGLERALLDKERRMMAAAGDSRAESAQGGTRGARDDRSLRGPLTSLQPIFVGAFEPALRARLVVELGEASLRIRVPDGLFFSHGSSRLLPEARESVPRIAAALLRCDGCSLTVEAHTDSILASQEENTWAVTEAQGRALIVALQGLGVDPSVLAYTSFGQYRPLASNETEEGRRENRRIELVVSPRVPASRGR